MVSRFRQRITYRFDNLMSQGTVAMIAALFAASLAVILVVCLLVQLLGVDPEGRGLLELAWGGLMLMFDAGPLDVGSGVWVFDVAMFLLILAGLFPMSTLIGLLTTCIDCRLDQLRKGRSRIVEEGHTIILGWSPQVFRIVHELDIANENQTSACVAILASRDKTAMADQLRERRVHKKHMRVVCRTGSPIDMTDLEIASPQTAKSIVVLAPPGPDPDVQVIKTILALTSSPTRSARPYHIVASIRIASNLQVARMVGGDDVTVVMADSVAARIAAQVCRQSGLSLVWTDLLDFGGDEIYFMHEPRLIGKTYAEAVHSYESSSVIGVRSAPGNVLINPPGETCLGPDDLVVAISEDDDTVIMSDRDGRAQVDREGLADHLGTQRTAPDAPEQLLIVGWNHRGAMLLHELDRYVPSGSTAIVLTDSAVTLNSGLGAEPVDGRAPYARATLGRMTVEFIQSQTTDRRALDALDIPNSFDHVIVLSDADLQDVQQADARTLITLLHLRDIADLCGHRFTIVSEMLDSANRELAQVTRADDFVVSDELISLLLTQISENRELADVFESLFDAAGSELYLKPADRYIRLGRSMTFYTVLEAALRRGETAIGYRSQAQAFDSAANFGVHLNPPKSESLVFSDEDSIVVLAEN